MSGLIVIDLLYLLLPAALANMAPVIAKRLGMLAFLDHPIDGGLKIHGKPFLGAHKTWRGLVSGIVGGIIVTGIQALVGPTRFDLVVYADVWLPLGAMLGAGALIGDALKSFFKRRVGIPEGSPWVPYDQIDFGIGAIVFALPFVQLGWPLSFTAVAAFALGHVLIVRIGYLIGWRKERW